LVDQLSFCYDASLPYVRGLAGVLSGQGTPDCAPCAVTLDAATRAWLLEQGAALGTAPRITRLAQWGDQVLMRAEGSGGAAVECFFEGMTVVTIKACRVVGELTLTPGPVAEYSRSPAGRGVSQRQAGVLELTDEPLSGVPAI
jgi:hypothetical protein